MAPCTRFNGHLCGINGSCNGTPRLGTSEKDWADRRAAAFYEEFIYPHLNPHMHFVGAGRVIHDLANSYRALASKCEPRDSIDM